MIASHVSNERAPALSVRNFVASLTEYVRSFTSVEKRQKENIDFIKAHFGYPEEDIKVSDLRVISRSCRFSARGCRLGCRRLSTPRIVLRCRAKLLPTRWTF